MKDRKTAFLKFVLLALLGWSTVMLGIWVILGNPFRTDAFLSEFGVCLSDTMYEPVVQVPIRSGRFYLCGNVVGSTGQSGSLLVRHNNKPVYSQSGTFGPGLFFQEVKVIDTFTVGEYEAIFAYSREQLATKNFTIE